MSIHYKFKSAKDYDTVTFDGLHISLDELKKAIAQQKKMGNIGIDWDLQVTNAQTKQTYANGDDLISKNTSLVVARVPVNLSKKSYDAQKQKLLPGAKDTMLTGSNVSLNVIGTDISAMDASEEDKIKTMMSQATSEYDPTTFVKLRGSNQVGPVPPSYVCYKCQKKGHWIKDCPSTHNTDGEQIRKSTGLPRSFMVPVEGPSVPGARITPTGTFVVPAIDHEVYKGKKVEKPPFLADQEPAAESPKIPEDLQCGICKDLLQDAVMAPCCGNSFCDECIRGVLVESEDSECPDCNEKDVSPDTLIPNRYLRNGVNNFKNQTGYIKRPVIMRVSVPAIKTPPRPTLPDFIPPTENGTTGVIDKKEDVTDDLKPQPVSDENKENNVPAEKQELKAPFSPPIPKEVPKLVHASDKEPMIGADAMLGMGVGEPPPPGVEPTLIPPPTYYASQPPPSLLVPGTPPVAEAIPPIANNSVGQRSGPPYRTDRCGTPTVDEPSSASYNRPPPGAFPPPLFNPDYTMGGPPPMPPYPMVYDQPMGMNHGMRYGGGYRGRGRGRYMNRGYHHHYGNVVPLLPGDEDERYRAFTRMLEEKEQRDKRKKRSRSRSPGRTRNRSRSRSRSRSKSPGREFAFNKTRSSRSRSIGRRSNSRKRSRSRSRSRSFVMSRSRSRSPSYPKSPMRSRRSRSPFREERPYRGGGGDYDWKTGGNRTKHSPSRHYGYNYPQRNNHPAYNRYKDDGYQAHASYSPPRGSYNHPSRFYDTRRERKRDDDDRDRGREKTRNRSRSASRGRAKSRERSPVSTRAEREVPKPVDEPKARERNDREPHDTGGHRSELTEEKPTHRTSHTRSRSISRALSKESDTSQGADSHHKIPLDEDAQKKEKKEKEGVKDKDGKKKKKKEKETEEEKAARRAKKKAKKEEKEKKKKGKGATSVDELNSNDKRMDMESFEESPKELNLQAVLPETGNIELRDVKTPTVSIPVDDEWVDSGKFVSSFKPIPTQSNPPPKEPTPENLEESEVGLQLSASYENLFETESIDDSLLPAPSRWERDDGGDEATFIHSMNPTAPTSSASTESRPPPITRHEVTGPSTSSKAQSVTSDVLKRAENAIFKKAVSGLRPKPIEKSDEKRRENRNRFESRSRTVIENPKESNAKEDKSVRSVEVVAAGRKGTEPRKPLQITIPSSNLIVDKDDIENDDSGRSPTTRVSVKDRLGSKIDIERDLTVSHMNKPRPEESSHSDSSHRQEKTVRRVESKISSRTIGDQKKRHRTTTESESSDSVLRKSKKKKVKAKKKKTKKKKRESSESSYSSESDDNRKRKRSKKKKKRSKH